MTYDQRFTGDRSQQSRSSYTERTERSSGYTSGQPPHFNHRNRQMAPNFRRDRYEQPSEPSPVVRTGPPGAHHVVFKGKYYDVRQLVASLGMGKRITINKSQLHKKAFELVDTSAAGPIDVTLPFVTPFEAGYVVLFGGDACHFGDEPVNVVMIPNMLLKKTFLWDVV